MRVKAHLRKLILQRWTIGFTETPLLDILSGKPIQYRWMKHSFDNRWFADPFLLDVTEDDYVVLAEDFEDERGYAVISKLIVDKSTLNLKSVTQLLDKGTHLSFPIFLKTGNDVFVYPEDSLSGELNLYRYDLQNEKLVKVETIMKAPITDAVLLEYEGEQLMFSTKLPNPNGNRLDVYIKKNGHYLLNEVVEMVGRTARMGGDFFWVDGALYRPAQDCTKRYGGALILQKAYVKDGKWLFEDVMRLTSPHPRYTTGLHTFNVCKGTVVVDIHGYRKHAWLSSVITRIVDIFRTRR